jgi:hypothetical protein
LIGSARESSTAVLMVRGVSMTNTGSILVAWLGFAVAGGLFARYRGRGAAGWMLVGALVSGPIAAVLLAILPPGEDRMPGGEFVISVVVVLMLAAAAAWLLFQ